MPITPKQINITVDLTRPGIVNTQKEMRYGDKNLLTVEVTQGGAVIDLATIGAVTTDLVVKRLGSTEIDVVGQIIAGKAQFMLDGSSLAVAGYTKAAVYFYDENGDRISSADFAFTSLADPSLNAVGDTTEQTIIQQVLLNGPPIIEAAAQAQEEFETQQAAFADFQEESETAFSNAQNQRSTDFNTSQGARDTAFGVEQTARQTDYTNWKDQKTDELNQLASDMENVKLAAETATVDANAAATAANNAATNANNKVTELNTYDTRLTNAEAEITNARQSTVKGKTFTTLDGRLEELDNDTYFPATNGVTNGDFSNGTTGWSGVGGDLSVSSGKLRYTANGTLTSAGRVDSNAITSNSGDKVFVKATITSPKSGNVTLRFSDVFATDVNVVANVPTTVTFIITSTGANVPLRVYVNRQGQLALGDVVEIDDVFQANLTQIFGGVANEPTQSEFSQMLSFYPNSFFSGTVNLAENKKMLKFLLNEIRANKTALGLKVDKAQEAWINPTLINGWTNVAGTPLQYMKDSLGFVRLSGLVQSGVNGQTVFNLPVGYRPSQNKYFIGRSGSNTICTILILPTGNVQVDLYNSYAAFDTVTFRAV